MICPHIVNVSMMLGAILSWGALWPLLATKAGDWFPAGLSEHDFKGLFGYKASPCPQHCQQEAECRSNAAVTNT